MSRILAVVKGRDAARLQDCPDCVDAFTRRPVGGKWELGLDVKPIRYHWTTPGESDMNRPRGICGARVISK